VEQRKLLSLPGLELQPLGIEPVASRYTDYIIPVRPSVDASHLISKTKFHAHTEPQANSYVCIIYYLTFWTTGEKTEPLRWPEW
jgi:hypothetical protein